MGLSDEEIYSFLKKESILSGKTISEIIRDTLKNRIRKDADNLIKSIRSVSGLWQDRINMDVDEYIRNIREDRHL